LHKHNVLKENKDKSGVYKLINRINNESYVGSSTNISKRLREYYCLNYLQNKMFEYNSRIYKALLNYGHKNFDLEILEYCDASLIICREQYYLDLLEPEYNICKTAGSMLGFKHSKETLLKFKNRKSITGHSITLVNKENNTIKIFNSIRSAAKYIGISHTNLLYHINKKTLAKGMFLVIKNNTFH